MNLEAQGKKALPILYFLYALSLLVSMAGMEIFSWTIAALVLVIAGYQVSKHRQSVGEIFLFVDFALVALLLVIIAGALLNAPPSPPGNTPFQIVGSARWILLFYLLRLGLYWTFHDNAQYALNFMLTAAGLVGIYAIVQHFTGIDLMRNTHEAVQFLGNRDDGSAIYRSAGFFSSPMRYGNSYGLLIFFPLAALITVKHKSKLFTGLMIFSATFLALSLVTTLVRGVWLGVIAGIIMMSFYSGRRKAIFTLSALLVFLGIVGVAVPAVRVRLMAAANNFSYDDSRVQIWRANVAIFKDHPFIGVGQNQNEVVIGRLLQKTWYRERSNWSCPRHLFAILIWHGRSRFLVLYVFHSLFLWISIRLLKMILKDLSGSAPSFLAQLGLRFSCTWVA